MTKGQRQRFSEIVWQIIRKRKLAGLPPDPVEASQQAFREHREEVVAEAMQLAQQQLVSLFRKAYKQPDNAPNGERIHQMSLPLTNIPVTYVCTNKKGEKERHYTDNLTDEQMTSAEEYLREKGRETIAKADDLRVIHDYLQPGYDANPGCTAWDAYKWINKKTD